jgi:hypothetical protein
MLIPSKHSGYQAGIRRYPKKGGGSAPPPDPALIAAQIKSMGIQDASIERIMAMADKLAPLQEEQMRFGIDSSRTAYDQSQEDRSWMLGRRGELSTMQDTLVKDAKDFNTAARTDQLVDEAQADVASGFSNARDQQIRAISRMGVNPSSGKALAMGNQMSIAQAAATAGVSSQARKSARAEGYALTDRASNALAGYPAMASGATGAGAGFGSNGITIANTGLAGLNSGNLSAASVAGQMGTNATGMWNAQANYKNQQDQIAASNDPWSSIFGAGAQLGAAWIGKSDRRLKQDIISVGMDLRTGLTLYEFSYTSDPAHRFRGVMADEVEQVMPEAVMYNAAGFASVDYGMLGIEMTEVEGMAS